MSGKTKNNKFLQLFAGRWQIPAALLAAGVGAIALYRMLPDPPTVDFRSVLADVSLLEEAGDLQAAADATANLLEMEPPLPPQQRAVLHDHFADLVYGAEQRRLEHNPENLEKLLEHDREAAALGRARTPQVKLRDAHAHMWLGHHDEALSAFRALLDEALSHADHRAALQAVVRLLEDSPDARLERQRMLADLLSDESLTPDYVWWALQRAVQGALDQGDSLGARDLIERYGWRLKSSDFKGYLDYVRALVMVHEGRPQAAEPVVQWIDDWLGQRARTACEMDKFGHLPSMNRWLMGRIHLAERRPQEALESFDAALAYRPTPELRIAATVGRGMALGALERHDAARQAFRETLDDLIDAPQERRAAVREFQAALLDLFDQRQAAHDPSSALAYLSMAAELTPRDQVERRLALLEKLGEAARAAAANTDDLKQKQEFHASAGRAFDQATSLVTFDGPRLAGLLWSAAEEYDRAGLLGDVRRTLKRFVRGRDGHPQMPRALLMLGQTCEAAGDLRAALQWYARVATEYPMQLEANWARVLRAKVLRSLGPEQYPAAEQILITLLTDGSVKPNADEFREALLTLCELLYQQQRYAEAIGRLEDFNTLYPDDTEHFRAGFMLANAYRRSAYALRDKPPADTPPSAARAESRVRFRAAADFYEKLLDELETAGGQDATLESYARLALFYRGDCLFELNEPDTLEAALSVYRNAAARYEGLPAALTAHVQIANIHLRLGDLTEAALALERAQWLLRTIPKDAFDATPGRRHVDWERFLTTALSSNLFRDVFAAAP